jgi:hypothetical protein
MVFDLAYSARACVEQLHSFLSIELKISLYYIKIKFGFFCFDTFPLSQRLYAEVAEAIWLYVLYALKCIGYILSCRGYMPKLLRLYAGNGGNEANSA